MGDATRTDTAEAPITSDVLLVVGDGTFTTVELRAMEIVIGRGSGCDLILEHGALSRRHAILRPGPPATVEDLGSHNGTRIAGVLRRGGPAVALGTGESFSIGPFSLVIVRRASKELSASVGDPLRVQDPTPDGVGELVRDIARSGVNVLVLGETGVGKEVLASTLHELSGRTGQLMRVNCAALSESLLESELFGHEKGSFTGATAHKTGLLEAAAGGTVFLDEVGELSPGIQAKLLRAVEQREVLRIGATRPVTLDVRFIAATNRDLVADVEAGAFRRDLFFRLDGVQLVIPPLRERSSAIPRLAKMFLERLGRADLHLGERAMAALQGHDWPGNVRELKAVVERAALLTRAGEIDPQHLRFARPAVIEEAPARKAATGEGIELTEDERADRGRIVRALDESAGNQTRAAKMLGMSRSALLIKLRVYRIPRPRG